MVGLGDEIRDPQGLCHEFGIPIKQPVLYNSLMECHVWVLITAHLKLLSTSCHGTCS